MTCVSNPEKTSHREDRVIIIIIIVIITKTVAVATIFSSHCDADGGGVR